MELKNDIDFVRDVVNSSKTFSEVLTKLGMDKHNRNQYVVLQDIFIYNDINYSNLIKKSDYTKETLEEAVRKSVSLTETAERLGHSDSYKAIVLFDIRRWNIDISHFVGRYRLSDPKKLLNGKDRFYFIPLESILSNLVQCKGTHLKERLFKEGLKKELCEICLRTEYLGTAIVLELNHINGNPSDNRLENLQILCSNCHSQTDTFAGRNLRKIFTDEEFIMAAKSENCMRRFLQLLGYKGDSRETVSHIKDRLKKLSIDTSHWEDTSKFSVNLGREFPSYIPASIYLKEGSNINSTRLKEKLFRERIKEKICEICDVTDWEGKYLAFCLDHINGLNRDNRLENLRILCFICHSRTPTFNGRNVKRLKIVNANGELDHLVSKKDSTRRKRQHLCTWNKPLQTGAILLAPDSGSRR